jgi:general secretion pathway protein H
MINLSYSDKGFTLMELLVVVAVTAVIALIATPAFFELQRTAQYKEAAREIAATLRDARARAVSQNFQHSVCFEVSSNSYMLVRGSCSTWPDANADWRTFSPAVIMRATSSCDDTTNKSIAFNPTGGSNSLYICVMTNDATPVEKFKVGVSSTATGRIVISD